MLVIISLFPWLVSLFTRLLGMQLPGKLCVHGVHLHPSGEALYDDIELSALENKVKDLTQELALEEKERRDELLIQKEKKESES